MKKSEELIKSLEESSKQNRNLQIFFLLFLFYIVVIAAETTDEQLLLNTNVILPVFQIQLPLYAFYAVSPIIIIILHFDLLFNLKEHMAKLKKHDRANKSLRANLFPFLFNYIDLYPWFTPGGALVRLSTWVTAYAFSLLALIYVQYKFIPYHDNFLFYFGLGYLEIYPFLGAIWAYGLTFAHQMCVFLDLILLTYFWPYIRYPNWQWSWLNVNVKEQMKPGTLFFIHCFIFVALLIFSFTVATVPTTNEEKFFGLKISDFLHRNLELREANLVKKAPPDYLLNSYLNKYGNYEKASYVAWYEDGQGVDLRGRDLRFADLSKSNLHKADFRGAFLQKTNFSSAQLQGVNFANAIMYKADLSYSRLDNANFDHTNLVLANVSYGDMRGSRIKEVNASGGDFNGTRMHGSSIIQSAFHGSSFQRANLFKTRISNSNFYGVDFVSASFRASTIISSTFRASNFEKANFEGAQAFGLKMYGANLTDSDIYLLDINPKNIVASIYLPDHDANLIVKNGAITSWDPAGNVFIIFEPSWDSDLEILNSIMPNAEYNKEYLDAINLKYKYEDKLNAFMLELRNTKHMPSNYCGNDIESFIYVNQTISCVDRVTAMSMLRISLDYTVANHARRIVDKTRHAYNEIYKYVYSQCPQMLHLVPEYDDVWLLPIKRPF